MKFHLGALPDDFEPDETWHPIIEPSPLLLQFVATPVALASGGLFFFLWQQVIDFEYPHIPAGWEFLWQLAIIASFPVLILVHELLHAAVFPKFGFGNQSLIGCWPSRMLFYAYHNGPLSRDRFLLVFAMPFLVISVVTLLIGACVPMPETVGSILAWFSIWNAFFACGDIVGFALILVQVPREAIVRNKSWRSFWKPGLLESYSQPDTLETLSSFRSRSD